MTDYLPEPFYPLYERVKKLLVKFIPVRRTRIRERAWIKTLHHCRLAVWKHRAFSLCKEKVETIVLGSSHATLGFIPDERSFNLSEIALDLYFNYALLKHWMDKMFAADGSHPNLKRVILFYDVFSPRNKLNLGSDCFRLIPYFELYGLDVQPGDRLRQDNIMRLPFDELRRLYRERIGRYRPHVDPRYRGAFYFDKRALATSEPSHVSARAASHMHLNRGEDSETTWVKSTFELCKAHDVELVLVIPPVRKDYREALGADEGQIFCAVRGIVVQNPEIRLLSYHSSEAFGEEDFSDADHLNRRGALKLTRLIHDHLGSCCQSVAGSNGLPSSGLPEGKRT